MEFVSEFIRKAREARSWSQRELAAKVNKRYGEGTISRTHIAMVELGQSNLSVEKMKVLTVVLSK